MTDPDRPDDLAERARMHDRLAASTGDAAARRMHQALAAEYRRRASAAGRDGLPPPLVSRPVIEARPARL